MRTPYDCHPWTYAERLGVPLRWWVQGTMLVASLWLAVVVALPGAAAWLVTGGRAGAAGRRALSVRRRPGSSVARRRLPRRPGPDRGPSTSAPPTALDAEATRRIAGVEADARAYLLLRPYLKRAVRVEITDPADPAPYWLVCTRHPDELAGRSRPDRTE